jgi:hypothetical protein
MEMAISTLNIELQKSKQEHKREMSKLKQDHEDTQAMLQAQLDQACASKKLLGKSFQV